MDLAEVDFVAWPVSLLHCVISPCGGILPVFNAIGHALSGPFSLIAYNLFEETVKSNNHNMKNESRNVLITGAGGNLGQGVVRQFVKEGFRVIATVEPGRSLGYDVPENVKVYPLNLRDEQETQGFVEMIINTYQSIDAAILLVGGFLSGGIQAAKGEDLRQMFSLNFETAYFVARPVFLQMQKQTQGGRIVLIGAKPGLQPETGTKFLAYTLSKSLLFRLAEILNAEGQDNNIVTSVIVPSTIDTPANRTQMPSADFSTWIRPEEIAATIEFLTSPLADRITSPVVKFFGNGPRRK